MYCRGEYLRMNIDTLERIEPIAILDAFNLAFSDYFVPLQLTSEQLEAKIKADKIDLSYSVGVFDERKRLIAFMLHGIDMVNEKKTIYNGGTGVIPEKRGLGLAKEMYKFILPTLKENGVDLLCLEVISENIQAIKSYERSGFAIERELTCYKGQIKELHVPMNLDMEIKELKKYDWLLMKSFWDFLPTWQNSIHVLDEIMGENIAIGAYIQSLLVGYLIYNPKSRRMQQIAVAKGFRQRNIGALLVKKLSEEHGTFLSVINVDKTSLPINQFLYKIGLEHFLNQHEMKLEFSK